MKAALTRYRVMAYVTGVVLAALVIVAIPVRVIIGGQAPTWYGLAWTAHGWLFLGYVITTIDLASRGRWKVVRTLLVMVAGTIPFMSFVAEHYVTKDVRARFLGADATASPAAAMDDGAPAPTPPARG